jgi:lauroyl/myristoyl acyltransferase
MNEHLFLHKPAAHTTAVKILVHECHCSTIPVNEIRVDPNYSERRSFLPPNKRHNNVCILTFEDHDLHHLSNKVGSNISYFTNS